MRTLDQALKNRNVWLTAECGATHTGLESAVNLVDIARQAGFDAVKFQIVESAKCPTPDEMFNGYKCVDIWKQRELTPGEWKVLKAYCNEKNIYSFTTITDAGQLDWFPSDMYKIRARDIGNLDLIKSVSARSSFLQVDVKWPMEHKQGGVDYIKWLFSESINNHVVLNHCPSGYPAKPEDEHLYMIKQYDNEGYIVGYSSHTGSVDNDLLALALGVDILEKPIIDYDIGRTKSIAPESLYALLPPIAKDYVTRIRRAEMALYAR